MAHDDIERHRERTLRVVRDYFHFQREKNLDAWIALWADDGVFVIPYAPEGLPNRIEGRATLEPLYRNLFDGYGEVRFHDLDVLPLLDPDRAVATWTTDLDLKAGGTYVNHLIALFELRAGKIVRYDEYFDPRRFAAAQARRDHGRWSEVLRRAHSPVTDVAAAENRTKYAATAFGWWRTDVPLATLYAYWRDVHGVLAARIPGLYQYRQLHLGKARSDLLPVIAGVDQSPARDIQPNGIAQLLFLTQDDVRTFGSHLFVTQHIFNDERNLVARNATLWSKTQETSTVLDRTGDAQPQGAPPNPAYVLAFRAAEGVSDAAIYAHVAERFVARWAERPELVRLRITCMEPYDDQAWRSPGVDHVWKPSERYQVWIELMLTSNAGWSTLLALSGVDHQKYLAALHLYPVEAVYTLVAGGQPTQVGLRGYPAFQTILAAGARNQLAPELVAALYGRSLPWSRSDASR